MKPENVVTQKKNTKQGPTNQIWLFRSMDNAKYEKSNDSNAIPTKPSSPPARRTLSLGTWCARIHFQTRDNQNEANKQKINEFIVYFR